LNDLAWILATDRAAELRDGAEALRLAQRLAQITGTPNARFLSALDAADAEVGRFPDAIHAAEKARAVAIAAGETNLAQAAKKRLELYRSGQPFRGTKPAGFE
jgi:tellurite resistance protein